MHEGSETLIGVTPTGLADDAADTASGIAANMSPSHTQDSASESMPRASKPIPPQDDPSASVYPQTHFVRSFTMLTSIYSDRANRFLKADTIVEIIRLIDAFLREDAETYIDAFRLGCSQNGFWDRPVLTNPTRGHTTIEKLFNGVCCAELLEQSSTVHPVRLRVARIILYHHYEQLCIDSRTNRYLLSRRSRSRDRASIATDKILEDMYDMQREQVDLRT